MDPTLITGTPQKGPPIYGNSHILCLGVLTLAQMTVSSSVAAQGDENAVGSLSAFLQSRPCPTDRVVGSPRFLCLWSECDWVAVKELNLSSDNGDTYIYIYLNILNYTSTDPKQYGQKYMG